MSSALRMTDVNFRYSASGDPTLCGVNLELKKGGFYSIIGPNGGGKSTLLKLILGLLAPDSGTIEVLNQSCHSARRYIGYMPQSQVIDSAFPIRAIDVVLMGRLKPWSWGKYSRSDYAMAIEAMEEMGVAALKDKQLSEISGGQRQRVLIARALACEPELLLLDEPTANIDPGAEEQFYHKLGELRRRMTLLTVSHDLGFVQKEVDMVICVNHQVSMHHVGEVDKELIDDLYNYGMHQILHSHSCGGGHHHE